MAILPYCEESICDRSKMPVVNVKRSFWELYYPQMNADTRR